MENEQFSLSVVIPAFNESAGIASVLEDLKSTLQQAGLCYEIIVVDDGSTDSTAALAAAAGATVISHTTNIGYGQALLTGFAHARYEHLTIIDADGSYPARELLKLLPCAKTYDMVIGARHGKHYWGTMFKYPVRIVFLWLAEYVTGQRIPDANSGLRIIKKSALPFGPILCRGFSFSTTLTLTFLSTGRFVKFVPIDYLSRKGSSKVRFLRDTLRAGQVLVEAIIYYNPLKLALPFALVPGAGSLFFLILFLSGLDRPDYTLLGWAILSFCFSMVIFLMGTIMDLMRLSRSKN